MLLLVAHSHPWLCSGVGGANPSSCHQWFPLHLGTVMSTWEVPLHTKASDFLAPRYFWLFWAGICKLNAGYCAGRFAGSPWQLSLYTKHHMAFFGGGGNESSRKINLCLWCCLSLLSVTCGEVETWSAGSWARLVLAMPPRVCR